MCFRLTLGVSTLNSFTLHYHVQYHVRLPHVLIKAWHLHLMDWIRCPSDSCGMFYHSRTITWQRSCAICSGCIAVVNISTCPTHVQLVTDRGQWLVRARCWCFWSGVHSACLATWQQALFCCSTLPRAYFCTNSATEFFMISSWHCKPMTASSL